MNGLQIERRKEAENAFLPGRAFAKYRSRLLLVSDGDRSDAQLVQPRLLNRIRRLGEQALGLLGLREGHNLYTAEAVYHVQDL